MKFSSFRLLSIFLFIFQPVILLAQLNADFTIDKSGGCSPLNVSFTSITSGAPANAEYHWDFGNGNTSSLKNVGAVFYEERQYTVTLTVKDGNQTSVKTRTITVYKKPTIDFTFSPNNGCLPMPVTFTGSSAPADPAITMWQWDFGDGTTQQSFSNPTIHTYTFEQVATVRLTATNDQGCVNTITKSNIIFVKKELLVDFNADKTMACFAPATISFMDHSSGPGTLSYYWEFGDGNTSAQASPSHTYTQRGIYTVKLTVTSSEGCVKTQTKNAFINVEEFVADFQAPSLICTERYTTFNNLSTPIPNQCTWLIDGTTTNYSYGNNPMGFNFNTEGMHTVQLTSNFGPCQRSITKQIEIKKTPKLNGFVSNIMGLCGAPVQVNFSDTTEGAVSWQWDFDWYNSSDVQSILQSPSFTYTSDNSYIVRLTVATADGCSETTSKSVGISRPLVGIFLAPGSSYDSCGPRTVKFEPRTTDPITSYNWNFGDGNTSTASEPVHTYQQPGNYSVSLTYVTSNGCTGTATYSTIYVRQKPVANFNVQPAVCGNTPVFFTNTTTGYATNFIWNFGDNTGDLWYNTNSHQYQADGSYSVRLIAYNGTCNDTIVKTNIINVSPPFAKIQGYTNTCDGTRGLVTFTDGSRQANSWHWDFGDGTTATYNSAQPSYSHTYTSTGTFKAVLSITNGACIVKDSVTVYVLLKQSPVLSLDVQQACVNTAVNYHVRGLENNPEPAYSYEYYVEKFEYSDGSPFNGYHNPYNYSTDLDGTITSYEIKDDKIRTITVSQYFNCRDTSNYVPIKFSGAKAGFEIVTDKVCFKSPVTLRDTSKSSAGNPITSWQWNFGDGNVQTSSQGGTVNHLYANPGNYYVSLKITDAGGCTSNSSVSQYVEVYGPKAAFYIPANVQLNTIVSFYNNSNTYGSPNTTWLWDFGNGTRSTDYSPSYTFTQPGDYLITLIAVNPQTGCRDTAQQTITVKDFNTGFNTNVSFIGNYGQCPPVLANFYNTSTNYTRLVWNFGDGTILENQYAPSHIYNVTGTYIVTLKVYGFNGLTGTFRDTINVGQLTATINADDIDGCIGHSVLLNAPVHTGAVSYLWDFGNGYMSNVADSFAIHQFQHAGSYTASVIVKDANGCRSIAVLNDKITIHPNPVVQIQPDEPVTCKETPAALQASGGDTYFWSPATGLNSATSSSPLALPPVTTTYQVNVTDVNGCKGNGSVTVIVPQPFNLDVTDEFNVCKGNIVQLNASGAETYKWINTTTDLSSTIIANPVASPSASTLYTLTGSDKYNCYKDTADVMVNVRSLPTVNAGPDKEVLFGSENILNTNASSDVIKWLWTPADFLNCTNCPSPVSKPQAAISYVVTVYTAYDCLAKDTILIKTICSADGIYIPNAFTPNNDGKNDRFMIVGSGIGMVRSFRVYNRWGEIVFEKKNFYPNDMNAAWNGRQKGVDAPAGVYVYFAELECNGGERFERKGSVTLVR